MHWGRLWDTRQCTHLMVGGGLVRVGLDGLKVNVDVAAARGQPQHMQQPCHNCPTHLQAQKCEPGSSRWLTSSGVRQTRYPISTAKRFPNRASSSARSSCTDVLSVNEWDGITLNCRLDVVADGKTHQPGKRAGNAVRQRRVHVGLLHASMVPSLPMISALTLCSSASTMLAERSTQAISTRSRAGSASNLCTTSQLHEIRVDTQLHRHSVDNDSSASGAARTRAWGERQRPAWQPAACPAAQTGSTPAAVTQSTHCRARPHRQQQQDHVARVGRQVHQHIHLRRVLALGGLEAARKCMHPP